MRVFRADNGVALDVNASPETIVNHLKDSLSKLCSIPVPDQILLCEGVKMESTNPLKFYGLPMAEKRVFLYDRRALQSDLPPSDVTIPNFDIRVPAPSPLPLEQKNSTHPVVWKLMEYESEFLERTNVAEAIRKLNEFRVEFARNLVFEQEIMVAALQSSFGPLSEHIGQVNQAYDAFVQKYKPESEQHELLLNTFEENMRKLKETRLHHTLVTSSGVQTLLDVVPEVRLRRWAEECANDHTQLKSRVSELSRQFSAVKESIENEKKKSPEPEFLDKKSLQLQLLKAEDCKADVQYLAQMLLVDYNTVKDRLSFSKRTPSNDLIDKLPEIRNNDISYLMKIKEREQSLKTIIQLIALSKNKLAKYIVERLRVVAALETKCREVANKVVAFHEAIVKQKQNFFQLVYVQRMPKAYQASLEEVLRRRKYAKKINFMLQKITDALAKVREEEIAKRKSYLENHGRFIPKDLILGLNESVPTFEIAVPNFDSSLPQIDNGSVSVSPEELASLLVAFGDDSHSSRFADLEKENEKLRAELQSVKSAKEEFQEHEKEKQLLDLKTSVLQKEELSRDYKKRIESLEGQLTASYARVERAEYLVQHFKEKVDDLEKQKRGEMDISLKKLEEAQKLVIEFDSAKSNLEVVVAKQSHAIEELTNQVTEAKNEVNAQAERVQELNQQKARADVKIAELSRDIELKTEEIDRLSHSVDYHNAEINELKQKVSELGTEKQNLLALIQDLRSKMEQLQDQEKKSREQENKLKALLDEKNRTILQQEDKINQIQSVSLQKSNSVQEISKNLVNEIESLQFKVRNLEEKAQQDDIKIKDHQAAAATYKARATKIEEEKKALNDQLVEVTQKSSKATEEKNWIIRQLNDKMSKMNETNSRLEEEKKKLQLLAAQATDRADKAEAQLRVAKPPSDDSKFVEAVKALEAKNKQNAELSRNVQVLEKKIATLENELGNLRTAVRKVQELMLDAKQSVGDDEDLSILRLKVESVILDRERLVKETDAHKAVVMDFNMKLDESEKKNQELLSRVTALEYELAHNRKPISESTPKIATSNYKPGDYVLFVPNKNSFYEAYPHGQNYYLSQEVLGNFQVETKSKSPIFGEVIEVVPSKTVLTYNPFNLPLGTQFCELWITK